MNDTGPMAHSSRGLDSDNRLLPGVPVNELALALPPVSLPDILACSQQEDCF